MGGVTVRVGGGVTVRVVVGSGAGLVSVQFYLYEIPTTQMQVVTFGGKTSIMKTFLLALRLNI